MTQLYIYNPVYEDQIITSENTIDFNILFHSYKHANFLRKKRLVLDWNIPVRIRNHQLILSKEK